MTPQLQFILRLPIYIMSYLWGERQLPRALKVVGLILLYYPFSIGLTFYQKWLLKDFKYPLSMVLCHYILKFIGVILLRPLLVWYTGEQRNVLQWPEYITRVAPIGVAASVDICLSNWALEYITVSLYTMAKSTCIIFILVFAVCLGLERMRCSIAVVISMVTIGFALFTYHAPEFDFLGFLLVELAALCAGLRWALSQFIMQKMGASSLRNPVDMIYHVQPWMIMCAVPMVFAFEGREISLSAKVFRYRDITAPLTFSLYVFTGGFLALCMELSEYLLLVNTSGLTLNVCGIFKEIVTLICANMFVGDRFTPLNLLGLSVCISGIALHVLIKSRQPQNTDDANHTANQHHHRQHSGIDNTKYETSPCPGSPNTFRMHRVAAGGGRIRRTSSSEPEKNALLADSGSESDDDVIILESSSHQKQ